MKEREEQMKTIWDEANDLAELTVKDMTESEKAFWTALFEMADAEDAKNNAGGLLC